MRSDALVAEARLAGAGFLGCAPEEVVFGQNMTTLNFALSRTVGRELRAGDEILATKLDHDANVAPWLELAHDLDLNVRLVELRDDTTLDLDDLRSKLSERTRVVAFPLASNAVGTLVDARRGRRARSRGGRARVGGCRALRAARTDRRCRARRRRLDLLALQVLRAASRHGVRPRRRPRALAAVQGAPGRRRARRQPLRDGHACARAARGLRRRGRLHRRRGLGTDPRARASARRAAPRGAPRRLAPPRPRDDGRPRPDVRRHARHPDAGRSCLATRRAKDRRVGRQLLRRRGDEPTRAAGRSRAHRDRPLQHPGRGRPAARSAAASSRRPSAASACRQSCARTCGSRPHRRRTTRGRA